MNRLLQLAIALSVLVLSGCSTDANVVSHNLSKQAEMFEINRRVIFYNGITGDYLLSIEGLCSLDDQMNQLEVTCKIGPKMFKKHFLGLSDNVTYFAEQLMPIKSSKYRYKVIFKPTIIIPDIDIGGV